MEIKEIPNKYNEKLDPIKEVMDIYIPKIKNHNIPHENGFNWLIVGPSGSGKTSMGLGMFKSKNYFKKKFHHIYYFIPEASYADIKDNPLGGDNINLFHDLTIPNLRQIYTETKELKRKNTEEKEEQEYNLIVIDDFAGSLKDNDIADVLNKVIPKWRHLNTSFMFFLQSYFYMPKILRKQLSYITIFKPQNIEEWESLMQELLRLKKDKMQILYDYVFDDKYNHLDLNKKKEKVYKNFNELIFS